MILLYPFADKKEKIRISSHYELRDSVLHVSYLVDDKDHRIEDFYPVEPADGTGTIFPLENLWTTTCFEIFLKNSQEHDYYEFNFNAKGEWNIFYFSEYRQRKDILNHSLELKFAHQVTMERSRLNFQIDLKKLDKLKIPCQVNMATIVKTALGVTYWSQKHNDQKADFHDPNNFTLKL
ncbi:MAG: hypothetical protein JNL11_04055 [Bdellovibrionaceae bacterium]|nr:hypothetical protein [Pseudobdellovibrionaceae bacterium]